MEQPIAAWSAQSQVDPNTGLPALQAAAPAAGTASVATPSYADLWSQAPTGTAPVRTWMDPAQAATPQGQFSAAWYDTPVQDAPGAPAATPLTGLIGTLQANPQAAVQSQANQEFQQGWMYGGGGGGDGSGSEGSAGPGGAAGSAGSPGGPGGDGGSGSGDAY